MLIFIGKGKMSTTFVVKIEYTKMVQNCQFTETVTVWKILFSGIVPVCRFFHFCIYYLNKQKEEKCKSNLNQNGRMF